MLFGCAAQPLPVEACASVTIEEAQATFPEKGIAQRVDLEGEPMDQLNAFLAAHVAGRIPSADRMLIFEQDNVALIIWFKDGCSVQHAIGPWQPIKQFLEGI